MASKATQIIPIITLIGAFALILVEGVYEIDLDYEALVPLFIAAGVGGIPLSIAKKAIATKEAIPKAIRDELLRRVVEDSRGSKD